MDQSLFVNVCHCHCELSGERTSHWELKEPRLRSPFSVGKTATCWSSNETRMSTVRAMDAEAIKDWKNETLARILVLNIRVEKMGQYIDLLLSSHSSVLHPP